MSKFPWSSIRIDVLAGLIHKDELFWQRHFCREFSRLFYTPLTEVELMPFEKVYRHVIEFNFDNSEEDKLVEAMSYELYGDSETPEERAKLEEQIAKWVEEDNKKIEQRKNKKASFEDMSGPKKFKRVNRSLEQKESIKKFDIPVDEE